MLFREPLSSTLGVSFTSFAFLFFFVVFFFGSSDTGAVASGAAFSGSTGCPSARAQLSTGASLFVGAGVSQENPPVSFGAPLSFQPVSPKAEGAALS